MTVPVALVYPLVLKPSTQISRGHAGRQAGTSAAHRWVPWGDHTGNYATLLVPPRGLHLRSAARRAAKGWL
jgi:hypothetical protein